MSYLSEGKKCLTCEHWGGNSTLMYGGSLEECRQATGKCSDSKSNNPNYYNGNRLSANDGCNFWVKHPRL